RIKSDFVAYACGNLSSFASNSSWQRPPRTSNDWSASSAKRHNPSCPRRLSCSPPKKNSGRPQCSRPRQCLFPALVFQHPRLVSTVITSELARQPQHNLPQRSDRHWRIRPLVGTNQHEDDPCCAAAPEQTKEGKTPVCRRTNSEHATIGSICLGRFSDPSSHFNLRRDQ